MDIKIIGLGALLVFAIVIAVTSVLRYRKIKGKNKLLEEALGVKNDVIHITNHQLRAALAIMQTAYNMVSDGSLVLEKGFEYWGSGLKRMTQAIEDFCNILQSENGMQPDIQKNDVTILVKEIIEDKKNILALTKKDINILLIEPTFVIPLVWCDAKQINNVLYNILDNAIFYTKQGSILINYEMTRDNKYIKVNIKDTGIGFSKEQAIKIGQKFYRTKQASLVRSDGSGLGLYICKKIVEQNKGKLFFESEGENKGSIFSFTLPVAR